MICMTIRHFEKSTYLRDHGKTYWTVSDSLLIATSAESAGDSRTSTRRAANNADLIALHRAYSVLAYRIPRHNSTSLSRTLCKDSQRSSRNINID